MTSNADDKKNEKQKKIIELFSKSKVYFWVSTFNTNIYVGQYIKVNDCVIKYIKETIDEETSKMVLFGLDYLASLSNAIIKIFKEKGLYYEKLTENSSICSECIWVSSIRCEKKSKIKISCEIREMTPMEIVNLFYFHEQNFSNNLIYNDIEKLYENLGIVFFKKKIKLILIKKMKAIEKNYSKFLKFYA